MDINFIEYAMIVSIIGNLCCIYLLRDLNRAEMKTIEYINMVMKAVNLHTEYVTQELKKIYDRLDKNV